MNYLFAIGGERGGIGKSMMSRALTGYLLDREIKFKLIDGDAMTKDIYDLYNQTELGCEVAYFAGGDNHDEAANAVFNCACEGHVVVNLPANNLRAFSDWYKSRRIAHWCKQFDVKIVQFFLTDGTDPSYTNLEESLNLMGKDVPHIIVKNLSKNGQWTAFNTGSPLMKILSVFDVKTMDMPKFQGSRLLQKLITDRVRFEDYLADKKNSVFERITVRNFLDPMWDALDEMDLFSDSTTAAAAAAEEVA